jgi:hypothetical protein
MEEVIISAFKIPRGGRSLVSGVFSIASFSSLSLKSLNSGGEGAGLRFLFSLFFAALRYQVKHPFFPALLHREAVLGSCAD